MSESKGRVSGGCFCGRVRFEVEREYLAYRYCFCSRCRKMRGTAHAANIFVAPEHFHWVSGEDQVKRFDLEGARFGNNFCTHCGAPAPRKLGENRGYLIAAGLLDEDPGIEPDRAIFWPDRAPWLPTPEKLEKREEY